MNPFSFKQSRERNSVWFIPFLFALFSILQLSGQNWYFGKYLLPLSDLALPPIPLSAPPIDYQLRVPMNGGSDLNNFMFLNQIGGVAFQEVAKPATDLAFNTLALYYDSLREDGSRLIVVIDQDTLTAAIFDWQLIPIIQYANSDFQSCVSLFGPRSTDQTHHIVYHPAFDNKLIGLRLLHSDIMLLDMREFWKVPTFDGVAVIGGGESIPPGNSWQDAEFRIRSVLVMQHFQSYVFTDYGEEIFFGRKGSTLTLTGAPYYHFWRADPFKYKIVQEGNKMYSVPEVIVLHDLIEKMKSRRPDLEQLNPLVYRAARNTMQFSALFRYAKQQNPENWKVLVKGLANVEIKPAIKTPVSWTP